MTAPELAAAMAETREIRKALGRLAERWEADAAKTEAVRSGSPDGAYRLLLETRAGQLRKHAREIRECAGLKQP